MSQRRVTGTNSRRIVASMGILPPIQIRITCKHRISTENTVSTRHSPKPKPQKAVKTQMAAYELGAPMTKPNSAVIKHVKLNALRV